MKVNEIKYLLADRNLKTVSARAGVSYSTLRSILKGRITDPSFSTVERLKTYLHSTCPACKD